MVDSYVGSFPSCTIYTSKQDLLDLDSGLNGVYEIEELMDD